MKTLILLGRPGVTLNYTIHERDTTTSHDKVFSQLPILSVIRVTVDKQFGYGRLKEIVVRRVDKKEYAFGVADFSRLHLNDTEDMFLLYVQCKLHNLTSGEIVDLKAIKRSSTSPGLKPHVMEFHSKSRTPHFMIEKELST
uniref:Uncharacterized protein n=1 Tax=Tanacetum cinerariifolium TaxID=118510 RepID=A0A699H116_TANCI|nr:hypothetical protein [Tanacetum cinerariifolium]